MKIKEKDIERFWPKVDIPVIGYGCWEWLRYKNPAGYGNFGVGEKVKLSHRVSWVINNGQIPDGLCVLHKCDNPGCVNPAHLFLGTRADNTRDAIKKGRLDTFRGELNHMAKLTKEEVLEIREEYKRGNISQSRLAKKYNIGQQNVWCIVNRISWKYI